MNEKKLERPLYIDMPFAEALVRYAKTVPAEVDPPKSRTRKSARPKPGAPVVPSAESADAPSDGDTSEPK